MIFLALLFLAVMLWIGFYITGAILLTLFWLFVEVPIGLLCIALGLVCFCTILLIPLGRLFFRWGAAMLLPG